MTNVLVCDDVEIDFYHCPKVGPLQRAFHFWFNTSFEEGEYILKLQKEEIEGAFKD